VSAFPVRACVCGVGLLLAVLAAPAAAAPNLLTNGGFETFGGAQTVFSDTVPDLAALTTVSGGFALTAGVLTSNRAAPGRAEAVVTNSDDYSSGTFQVRVTPLDTHPELTAGQVRAAGDDRGPTGWLGRADRDRGPAGPRPRRRVGERRGRPPAAVLRVGGVRRRSPADGCRVGVDHVHTAGCDQLRGRIGRRSVMAVESPSGTTTTLGIVDPISSPRRLDHALDAVVSSNSTWQLSVAGSGDFADAAGKTFPLAQLGWQRTGSGAGFTPFSTAAGTISTGAATPAGGTPTPLDLRLTVSYADPISSLPFQSSLTYMAATP